MNIKGKKILVTGGAGFLGSHVCEEIARRGGTATPLSSKDGDLMSGANVRELACRCKTDAVVHCAALCGGIGANRERPGDFAAINLGMGLNVINHCAHSKIKLVVIGTTCSYPENCAVPFRESDLFNGYPEPTNAPYGIAKRTIGALAEAYHRQYGLDVAYVIPANLYGPRDQSDHVIPDMIRKFSEAASSGADATLWGNGSPTRDFLFVEDAARGVVDALERDVGPEPINLGTGVEITIANLANHVADAVGFKGVIRWDASKPNGQMRRCLDTARAKARLGWQATTSLSEGLRRTVAS